MINQESLLNQNISKWLQSHYGIKGKLTQLVGDEDLNYRCQSEKTAYTVKISPTKTIDDFAFESALLKHLSDNKPSTLQLPAPVPNQRQQWISTIKHGDSSVCMRLLSWVTGELWSNHKPHSESLLCSLGQQAAVMDVALTEFEHPLSKREFDWDLAQCLWVKKHMELFSDNQQKALNHFIDLFEHNLSNYEALRQQVIHNDLNDNNILLETDDAFTAKVTGFIDFGDAIHTQLINEVAIACAYAIMDKNDPLSAAKHIITGYHQINPLQAAELQHLYHLIGMRLVVSVTQSALAKAEQPDNDYKSISEQPAWELLASWQQIHPHFAHYHFRQACGLTPHPDENELNDFLKKQPVTLQDMFPEHTDKTGIEHIDLSVGSPLVGHAGDYENHALHQFKLQQLQQQYRNQLLAGGYGESRSFYASDAFSIEGNAGKEYRTIHLGLDVWLSADTAIHAPLDGIIVGIQNNDHKRDYGPTLIVQHQYNTSSGVNHFYTLYGHLSAETLELHQKGDEVKVGQLLAWIGENHENGGWNPHLHFQIMHDLLNHQGDFPGACTPNNWPVMQSNCPDPQQLFGYPQPEAEKVSNQQLITFRQQHLGKSLSLAYSEPIQMLRGDDVYLIDQYGQKYLDTCNNVAHVGHEHPQVVKAGQAQMAVLNTNSRYLHPALVDFTEALLATLPAELSVVHLVNSGSEANELALRMAKAWSGGQEVIALESGYHGNSNACIDISSYKFDGKGGKGAPEHTHIVPLPDAFRGRHRGEHCAAEYANYVDQAIKSIANSGKTLSAFIAESIVSCGGQIELPAGYLTQVYQSVRDAGGLCIADEVQVGCGRIGSHFWAFEPHGVVPDILTIGKPIGNGHPLAVVVCTREVADRFANGMEYFNTFGGNPVSATIGLSVLKVIKEQKLLANALHTGNHLKSGLLQLQQQFPIIKDVRGQGLFLGFELCDDDLQPLARQASYLANRMRDMGILISTDGPDYNVIKIKPPITFSTNHADELLSRLEFILAESAMQI
jgi:4-aminobutyrate aminotransferase-like enzyme/Ser/Thr protein kinase RdoA (MazF antagonist)